MHKLLITGSKGQLGTDCLDVFRGAYDVTGVDLPEVDLSDRSQCMAVLERINPEVIVNCAAYTAVDACETDRSCWKANAELPGFLAEWVEQSGGFLVHVSTDYVFAGDKPLYEACVESDSPAPLSEYGKSKLAGERAIAARTDRFAVLRTAWLYGAHGRNFLKTMLRLTLQNPGKEFKVVDDQFGSPTWSHTLARQICAVVEQRAAGIFHATSEGYCTWYGLASAFLEELGVEHRFVPCGTNEFPTPTRRPANSILENARLKELGINLFHDWKSELHNFAMQNRESVLKEIKGT